MRVLLLVFSFIAALAIDTFAFDGRYHRAAWREAQRQADRFNAEVGYWASKLSPNRARGAERNPIIQRQSQNGPQCIRAGRIVASG